MRQPVRVPRLLSQVHNREDDNDCEGESPHADDSNKVGMAVMRGRARQPAKEGNDGGDDVDRKNRAHKLP
jgi:hypothetical protein